MLQIKSKIPQTLPKIEVHLKGPDEKRIYEYAAGQAYPVIQLNRTVISATDLMSFDLDIGDKLPTLEFTVDISDSQFLESDFVTVGSELLVFIGNTRFGKAFKMQFDILGISTRLNVMTIRALLKIPNDKLIVHSDGVEKQLKELCNKSGLGLQLQYDCSSEEFKNFENYVNLTTYDMIEKIANRYRLHWFIDHDYVLHFDDIKTSIESHKPAEVANVISTGESLEQPEKIVFHNGLETTQFAIENWCNDYSFNVADERSYVQVKYDKKAEIDFAKEQVSEISFANPITPYDLVTIQIEMRFNPFIITGQTIDVELYTTESNAKRKPANQDVERNFNQEKISDYSGVYYIRSVSYEYFKGQKLRQVAKISKLDI